MNIGFRSLASRLAVSSSFSMDAAFLADPKPKAEPVCDRPPPILAPAPTGGSQPIAPLAAAAASAALREGGSPAAQLKAAKAIDKRAPYRPHQGAAERFRRMARKAPTTFSKPRLVASSDDIE